MPRPLAKMLQAPALALALAALAACSSMNVRQEAIEKTDAARTGPERPPFRSITGFSGALRCMDNLMIDYGVRDVSMLVEEVNDTTKKVNAGTRDMLITAVSDMTRRSRAVRIVAFGKDAANVISFLASAQRQSAYQVVPQYDIKGSVSQLDENVIRNQKDLGVGFQPFINLGIARDAASSVLGLDLSVLTTDTMSVLPGVTSRNSVVILKEGRGFDADAAYHKFGLNFSMTLSKSEGQSQALRGLVELAVVELVGKLTKTPYWSCLGAEPDANEEIRQEIDDWFFAMAATRIEVIAYFQNQLRRRGYYDGPIDGNFNPALDEAVTQLRGALGLSREPKIDPVLFAAYLRSDHSTLAVPAEPARWPPPQAAAPANAPLGLSLAAADRQTRFAPGQTYSLLVQPSRDAHVYCYLQDETTRIRRFFPNRFAHDSLVSGQRPLQLPGTMRFQLSLNTKGAPETVACFATARDVADKLPDTVLGTDFEPLPAASFDQIRRAFAAAAGDGLAQETFHVQAR